MNGKIYSIEHSAANREVACVTNWDPAFCLPFCFTFLYGPMTSRKVLVQTTKWSTSPKIPDFLNGRKPPWRPYSYLGWKFKCQQFKYCWKGTFIMINIVLRTTVQKWTHFELLTEKQREIFLKFVGVFVKNC